MTVFELALLIGCVAAALVNRLDPRVLAWIGAGIASYVASSIYYAGGWAYHPFATAMADASVCLLVYHYGKYRWEMWVWRAFQASAGVSTIYLALQFLGYEPSPYAYALFLEAGNWLALFAIASPGVSDVVGYGTSISTWDPGLRFHRTLHLVRQKRAEAPFTKVRR